MNEKIIWSIIETIASLTECYLITYYIANFLVYKSTEKTFRKFMFIFSVTACNNLLVSRIITIDAAIGTIQIVIAFLFSIIFFKGSIAKKIFVAFSSVFLILIINSSVLSLFSGALKEDVQFLISSVGIFRLMILFITKFLYFVAITIIIKLYRKEEYHLKKEEVIYISCIFFLTLITGNVMFEYVLRNNGYNDMFFNVVFISLIALNVISYAMMRRMSKLYTSTADRGDPSEDEISDHEQTLYNIKIHDNQVNHLKKQTDEILTTSLCLIKNGLYREVENYLEHICHKDNTIHIKSIHTSNSVINAVINTKLYECSKKKIAANVNITGSVDLFQENDIGIILSAVMGRAIEQCSSDDAAYEIGLKITDSDEFLSIMLCFDSSDYIEDSEINKFIMDISENPDIKRFIEKYDGAVVSGNNPCLISFSIWLKIEKAVLYLKNSCLTADAR